MRRVAHLSDLHFGRTDCLMVSALLESLARLRPDLVVISGDFTQRAKSREFQEARTFLDALPAPYLGVPGNHDIRLYDLYGRFVRPLQRYKRFISEDVEPFYGDSELTIVSLNTARSLTFKGGRINEEQVSRVIRELRDSTPGSIRILVAHHPLDLPNTLNHSLAGGSRTALAAFADSGLDVILSGHLHVPYLPGNVEKLRVGGHTALLVQAGTAVSTRSRGYQNSFNSIDTQPDQITITQHCWAPDKNDFEDGSRVCYRRQESRWMRQDT